MFCLLMRVRSRFYTKRCAWQLAHDLLLCSKYRTAQCSSCRTHTYFRMGSWCLYFKTLLYFFQSYGDILNKQIMRANMKLTKKDTDIAKFDDDGNHPAARTVMIVTVS